MAYSVCYAPFELNVRCYLKFIQNTDLNDLRKVICLRKSEVSVERTSACNVKFGGAGHTLYAMLLYQ